jgi:hypothetical protein
VSALPPSITQSQVQTALRGFLLGVLPSGVEIIEGLDNRVSEPSATDFVVMTPLLRDRVELNSTTWSGTAPTTLSISQPTLVSMQLDVHGPNSAENAQTISTLFRDETGVSAFVASGYDVTPLYAESPKLIPFKNAEDQIEFRYVVDVAMQANIVISPAQDFANQLSVTTIEVDTTYAP